MSIEGGVRGVGRSLFPPMFEWERGITRLISYAIEIRPHGVLEPLRYPQSHFSRKLEKASLVAWVLIGISLLVSRDVPD